MERETHPVKMLQNWWKDSWKKGSLISPVHWSYKWNVLHLASEQLYPFSTLDEISNIHVIILWAWFTRCLTSKRVLDGGRIWELFSVHVLRTEVVIKHWLFCNNQQVVSFLHTQIQRSCSGWLTPFIYRMIHEIELIINHACNYHLQMMKWIYMTFFLSMIFFLS